MNFEENEREDEELKCLKMVVCLNSNIGNGHDSETEREDCGGRWVNKMVTLGMQEYKKQIVVSKW